MTPGARIAAAIDILATLDEARRPVADVLKEWGFAHRFAGSKDRSAIAALAYDALRRKASSARPVSEPEQPVRGVPQQLRPLGRLRDEVLDQFEQRTVIDPLRGPQERPVGPPYAAVGTE